MEENIPPPITNDPIIKQRNASQQRLKRKLIINQKRGAKRNHINSLLERALPKHGGQAFIPDRRGCIPLANITNVASNLRTCFAEIDSRNIPDKETTSRLQEVGSNSDSQSVAVVEFLDLGDPTYECSLCGASMWYEERLNKSRKSINPEFSLCCSRGKVQLPRMQEPPQVLKCLLCGIDSRSKDFVDNIRAYNMMFSFTSMGGKIDTTINNGNGPYVYRLYGQNYHRIGSLLPNLGSTPKFAQLYIFDTENEVANRMGVVSTRTPSQAYDTSTIEDLKKMLNENNVLVQTFRSVKDRLSSSEFRELKLIIRGDRATDGRRYNTPTAAEIAGIIVGDIGSSNNYRDIIVETRSGYLRRINELHPCYLALQYPLLFPYGEDGYRKDILMSGNNKSKRECLSMRQYFCFRIQQRRSEFATFLLARKLFQQFVVDAYTMIEAERLSFIRYNQKKLRAEMYKGLTESVLRGETNPSAQGKRIILPSTYVGGARYMIQNYQDAMAICRWTGYPDIFITFTCNSKWPEIQKFVEQTGLKVQDRPDIICRIFKMKLDELCRDLKHKQLFGRTKALLYTVEFQKRGLPHAHILVFLHREDKHPAGNDIDKIISAEIPDKKNSPRLYQVVLDYMMHGPCGVANNKSPCMVDGKCTKHFPKRFIKETMLDGDGYPLYRRRDNGDFIEKAGASLDNRYVVPYNPWLLLKYEAHINVEWCNQHRSIKYLFKYVNKGNDRITVSFYQSNDSGSSEGIQDEIAQYYNCRYISSCEAAWRIFAFPINHREPGVERLSFHLPDEQTIIFEDDDPIDSVLNRCREGNSMFLHWMQANTEFDEARQLTYVEFPQQFVYKEITIQEGTLFKKKKKWAPRQRGFCVGRIFYVHPGAGELYYLRLMLNFVKGPTCYDDIKTVNGTLYPTFKDACYALGLLDDDKEYVDAIKEASFWGSGNYLRNLFASLLFTNCLSRPEHVWEQTWSILTEDILCRQRNILHIEDLQMDDEQLKSHGLAEIELILTRNGKSLREYPSLPFPDAFVLEEGQNRLIQEEQNYDRASLAIEFEHLFANLNNEQKRVYDSIMEAVLKDEGGVFFVYGYGGTGKTFIWRTLSCALRSKGEIVLTVASSGIAALLIPGGRTAHSRFAIPLVINEDSICNITQGSPFVSLFAKARLVIWDEAPMVHKHCFEALDRSLRDLLRFTNPNSMNMPFGGKVVVFGGDFRQILPVIPKGRRQDVVSASLNSSYLWDFCKVLKLTKNMRLCSGHKGIDVEDLNTFSEWILKVGDGNVGDDNDGESDVQIPNDLLIKDSTNHIEAIVNNTYPGLLTNSKDCSYLQDRAILCPTLEIVHEVNDFIMAKWPGVAETYLSSDSICKADGNIDCPEDVYTPEFLNSITASGLPNHVLTLKVGIPVMLLRNIDQTSGLCNGTRLVITNLGKHVIEAKIISGFNTGYKVFISRMVLTPSDLRLPFKLRRRQYPLIVCFAMTINKSQGQSLSHVGLYLPRPVFTHGQLYVAISRVKSRSGLKILICNEDGKTSDHTKNVVYKEVFGNLA